MDADYITVGKIVSAHGVRGAVKVFSETDTPSNILKYRPWYLRRQGQWVEAKVLGGHPQGAAVVAQLEGVNDRDAAQALAHTDVAIKRSQLPALKQGEYYWADLVGLKVLNQQDVELGVVRELFATGANDVLVVQGEVERLIPYVTGVIVLEVDLKSGIMRVDWEPDY